MQPSKKKKQIHKDTKLSTQKKKITPKQEYKRRNKKNPKKEYKLHTKKKKILSMFGLIQISTSQVLIWFVGIFSSEATLNKN